MLLICRDLLFFPSEYSTLEILSYGYIGKKSKHKSGTEKHTAKISPIFTLVYYGAVQ